MSVRVEVTSTGLRAIRDLAIDLSKMPLNEVEKMMQEVRDDGIAAMQDSIALTTGEKSTGALMDSIEGDVSKEGSTYKISVGSKLGYSKYAASNIVATVMNRPVMVMPGKWRWIGTRPPMPAHPFLIDSVNAMVVSIEDRVPQNLNEGVGNIFREAEAKEHETP